MGLYPNQTQFILVHPQDLAYPHSNTGMEGVHEAPFLAEELLVANCCWGAGQSFFHQWCVATGKFTVSVNNP